ncbi:MULTISPECIES: hypothetical protein [unclassified Mesorhizobium]|nr:MULTISPECIES: hypothetical protein [unclassified Mesorhizobium]
MLLYATQKIAAGVFERVDSFVILARRGLAPVERHPLLSAS